MAKRYKIMRGTETIYLESESEMLRFRRQPGDVLYYEAVFGWMWVPNQSDHARMPQLSDFQRGH